MGRRPAVRVRLLDRAIALEAEAAEVAGRSVFDLLPAADLAFADLDDLEARWPARLGDQQEALDRSWHRIRELTARLSAPPGGGGSPVP